MSLETLVSNLESNLANMNLSNKNRCAPILEPPIIQEIFANDADIYSAEKEIRHYILEVPNVYCGRYYDDEDFIYTKLTLSRPSSSDGMDGDDEMDEIDSIEDSDLDYLEYMMQHNIIISNVEIDLNPSAIMAKILYIYQYVTSYYTSLRHLRPVDRTRHMPSDLLMWISNMVDTTRILLDRDLFNYTANENIPLEMFREMVYGIGLITCHIRLICNHYPMVGVDMQSNGNWNWIDKMDENHLKKLMRLVNNLCVIMIYFWKML